MACFLSKGSTGDKVNKLQSKLKDLGYYKYKVDGKFGDKTKEAVIAYQKDKKITVDGCVGNQTWNLLFPVVTPITVPVNTVHKLTLAQYLEMTSRITKWQVANKTERTPNYVDISDMNVGVNKVYIEQIVDMARRVKAWTDSHNGQMPYTVGIEKAVSDIVTYGKVRTGLMDAVGHFESFTGFYNLCIGRNYSYYYNDIYNQEEAIARLKAKKGLNCTDITQLGYALAIEMKYEARFIHVTCKSGAGHIRMQIKGKEFANWTNVDLASALSVGSKYPIGKVWCPDGSAFISYEKWLLNDDGVT